jgi:hypothetical protein
MCGKLELTQRFQMIIFFKSAKSDAKIRQNPPGRIGQYARIPPEIRSLFSRFSPKGSFLCYFSADLALSQKWPGLSICGSPDPNPTPEKKSTPTPTPNSGVRFSGVRESQMVPNIVGRRSELRYPPYPLGQKSGTPPYPFEKISY